MKIIAFLIQIVLFFGIFLILEKVSKLPMWVGFPIGLLSSATIVILIFITGLLYVKE